MSLLGVRLTLLVGPTVALPAPPQLMQAIDRVEVRNGESGAAGFQVTFRVGRADRLDFLDYQLLHSPLLAAGNRIVIVVTFGIRPRVLFDGIICHQELAPSDRPGASILVITGNDLTVMMDRERKIAEHPAQDDGVIVTKLIAGYARYGIIPEVTPPPAADVPSPLDRVPVQRATDLEYIRALARRHGYVFHLVPGPVPLQSRAYFGPPVRTGRPQPALSVNLGGETNVESINFRYDASRAARVSGNVLDPELGTALPVRTFASTRSPLASRPALADRFASSRISLLEGGSGLSYAQASARAQAQTDASTDAVLTATGELDAVRYGGVLEPRGLVGVRGAGLSHDGFYYIESVTHVIREGDYRQQFKLTREGLGSTTLVV
jgi:hypothetical protein